MKLPHTGRDFPYLAMDVNEKIADWLGYEYNPRKGLRIPFWVHPDTGLVASIEFNHYLQLWHGKGGVLAQIEKRNASSNNFFAIGFKEALDEILLNAAMARHGERYYDLLDAVSVTPAQLAAALVKMIKEGVKL